jgi:hypothetical protein
MALGEMLTKLPSDAVSDFAARCVRVLVALVQTDREWSVVDAACGALASVVVAFPLSVALHGDDCDDDAPSSSSIAKKMFEILPLNVGHAASVLVALMRVAAAGVAQSVEEYVRSNVLAYTKQNFSAALTSMSRIVESLTTPILHFSARPKPLGVRLMKDDSGLVSATPLVSNDETIRPSYVSPSATAAAAVAALPAPVAAPVQPWEMTASCLSLLAASSAHYPHLVSDLFKGLNLTLCFPCTFL